MAKRFCSFVKFPMFLIFCLDGVTQTRYFVLYVQIKILFVISGTFGHLDIVYFHGFELLSSYHEVHQFLQFVIGYKMKYASLQLYLLKFQLILQQIFNRLITLKKPPKCESVLHTESSVRLKKVIRALCKVVIFSLRPTHV